MSENKHTKRISLTQGQFAIVDYKDYEWLSQFKWFAWWNKHTQSFYAVRDIYLGGGRKNQRTKRIYMAREILGLKYGDKRQSDHINHITLDNSKSNLRIVTNQQNQFNRQNNKGYTFYKRDDVYCAQIKLKGEVIYLGRFATAPEAHNAYLKAKQKYHKFGR